MGSGQSGRSPEVSNSAQTGARVCGLACSINPASVQPAEDFEGCVLIWLKAQPLRDVEMNFVEDTQSVFEKGIPIGVFA